MRPDSATVTTEGDVERARRVFSGTLHRRLGELGIAEKQRVTWLQEQLGEKRWQTVQFWLEGKSFPQGHRLRRLADVLRMNASELVGPMADQIDPPWPTWREFLATKDGQTVDDEERWQLRLFSWAKAPTVEDYRALLVVVRNNASRS